MGGEICFYIKNRCKKYQIKIRQIIPPHRIFNFAASIPFRFDTHNFDFKSLFGAMTTFIIINTRKFSDIKPLLR